jgi:endonuclease/exonuclease/phosphatase family metal-dependent hydrolase
MLQECFNRLSSIPLPTIFPEYNICRGKMKGLALVNSGLVTLSQYPIVSHQFVEFTRFTVLSADALSNKGFLACTIQLPEQQVCFINTHLQSCEHSDYDPVVKDQLRQIFQFARGLSIPYVVGGDFNINHTELAQTLYAPAVVKAPVQPTIYINLASGASRSSPKQGYQPYTFDYFFVHPSLNFQQVVSEQDDYSDHNPSFLQ